MKHNQSTIDLIKQTRTYCKDLSLDARGKLVIGWEHKVKERSNRKGEFMNSPFSLEEAETLLIKDLTNIDIGLKPVLKVSLSQRQYNAVVSFCYDISVKSFKHSGILDLINNYKFTEASSLLRQWNTYLKQRIYKLTKLRKIEIQLLTTNKEE